MNKVNEADATHVTERRTCVENAGTLVIKMNDYRGLKRKVGALNGWGTRRGTTSRGKGNG